MIAALKNNILNTISWKTNRKIVVFESDDWGSIRMSSKESYQKLLDKGYPVDYCAYSSNDALESNEDVHYLAEVLLEVKDKNGNPACITLNMLSANPDYDKIKQNNFQEYYWEPFAKTLSDYPSHHNVMQLYKEGVRSKVFRPQLHGREHINVSRWFDALQKGEQRSLDAFENRTISLPKVKKTNGRKDFMDSFGLQVETSSDSYEQILLDAADVFNKTWGFSSSTFMAPCYTWHPELEHHLKDVGVEALQGTYVQRIPDETKKIKVRRKYHFMGQKNKLQQRYLIRNVFFEPTEFKSNFNIEDTLRDIQKAFKFRTPAIIQTHRLNYIGFINQENRDTNLKGLQNLLQQIVKLYPDVEFMSSDQLVDIMNGRNGK